MNLKILMENGFFVGHGTAKMTNWKLTHKNQRRNLLRKKNLNFLLKISRRRKILLHMRSHSSEDLYKIYLSDLLIMKNSNEGSLQDFIFGEIF